MSLLSFCLSAGFGEKPAGQRRGLQVPGLTGERAVGQRRQTVFVVVLAVVLEDIEKERTCPAANAGAISAAME
ncbi:hypothetical protein ADU59_20530 [Pararhizobium polonicum]|uniref:Uncharacterized protein n=1 Tax=Pararhizobium polonicum TaxID=1612624 RepID=A0A1C7NX96_9HYPH|nr:hypothetical protein ADU59_20530 [Pararhizobium polonicum]